MENKKDFSSAQEQLVADYLGEDFYTVSGSGKDPSNPGDVKSEQFLIECKTHTTKDFKIIFRRSVWDKLKQEAISQRKTPVLVTDDGTQTIEKTWVLMDSKMIPPIIKKYIATQQIVKQINRGSISVLESDLAEIYYKRYRDYGNEDIAYFEWDARTLVAIMPIRIFKDVILKER